MGVWIRGFSRNHIGNVMYKETLGLVAVKEYSGRFPGKNFEDVYGEPLFWCAVSPLVECGLVDRVYVITDSVYAMDYCMVRDVGVIWRPKNAARDEDKLINVLRFGYYSLDEEYDIVVAIMANCFGQTVEDVEDAINLLRKKNLREVRSFDAGGSENGLLVFRSEILEDSRDISYYIGGIVSDAREVHRREDLWT